MRNNKYFRDGLVWPPVLVALICIVSACSINDAVMGQNHPGTLDVPRSSHDENVEYDSGFCDNEGSYGVVWSKTIKIKDAKWLQLHLRDVVLTESKLESSKLRITSLKDDAYQILDKTTCQQWQDKSAYFNGDEVKIELLAHANAERNRVVIEMVTVGDIPDLSEETICGSTDNRQLSNDRRVGRTNNGCSAWLFNGRDNCMITAGHCADTLNTVFFNVPISNTDGSLNFPPPADQYAVDPASIQFENGDFLGTDWCYFGCFNNSTTGRTPLASQSGSSYRAEIPNSSTFNSNSVIRITGFGSTSAPVSPTFNQAQKTHAGPFVSFVGNVLRYGADTTGGNSGSPVIDEASGIVYGVHTNGGCTATGGSNVGTGCNQPNFANAIANPTGVCAAPPAPVNNNCQNGVDISDGVRSFDTTSATTDGPALPADCEEGSGLDFVNDIWFVYEATCTGTATFDFSGSDYDTRVAAYTDDGGCPGSLIACDDDSGTGLDSLMTFDAVEGAVYIIRVGGFSGSGVGTVDVSCTASACRVNISLDGSDLLIDGTQGPDVILVTQDGGTLIGVINDGECVVTLPIASVENVIIRTFGGADEVIVNASVNTGIDSGFGPDKITGGPLVNVILAGPGADDILGGPQEDLIIAGRGNDTVLAFAGDDFIDGGDATDILRGGSGADEIIGGLGADQLFGEGGDDVLTGNTGADRLDGGAGNDSLSGLGGPDELLGGPGNDELTGGAGFDTLDGGGGVDTAVDNGEVEVRIENT